MIIAEIETWACDTPIAKPIDLGNFTVRKRSYLAVRVRTADGLEADCVTQSRGSPIDVMIAEVLAPRLLGKDARDVAAIRIDLARELTALEMDGAIGRAWSALEICLQGLRATACGWPLWRLLGGAPREVPVLLVEGYAIEGERPETFVDRLVERVEQGFRLLKVEAGHYTDDGLLIRQLIDFRKRAGGAPRLVLDMAWSWKQSKPKLAALALLEELGIEWIEDPYASDNVAGFKSLRDRSDVAIGGGDETSRLNSMFTLLEASALDVIRVDATTMGGIDGARSLSTEADRRGVRVAYHVHPEVHEHLVFGLGIADHIEMFPTDRHFDRVHDLIDDPAYSRVEGGMLAAVESPGTGVRVSPEKMTPFVRRHLHSRWKQPS